jgi:hypothetical protein
VHLENKKRRLRNALLQWMFPTTLYGQNERAFNLYYGAKTTHNDIGNFHTLMNNDSYDWIKNRAKLAGVAF